MVTALSEAFLDLVAVSMSCGANVRFGLSCSFGCAASADAVDGGCVSSAGGEACRRRLFVDISTGCGANLLFGFFSPCTSAFRPSFVDVSTGSTANFRGAFLACSSCCGLCLLDFVLVSTGTGANLRGAIAADLGSW